MAKTKTTTTVESFEVDELVALARLDMDRGNVEAALSKLKQVLAGADPLSEAQAMAARLYAQLGLFERARPLYQAYLQSNPEAITDPKQPRHGARRADRRRLCRRRRLYAGQCVDGIAVSDTAGGGVHDSRPC